MSPSHDILTSASFTFPSKSSLQNKTVGIYNIRYILLRKIMRPKEMSFY